jgi:hypothetical protein
LKSSSFFWSSSRAAAVSPVTFPPGRARLATKPCSIGLALVAITIGMVSVACFKARIVSPPDATRTSTGRPTSSAARPSSRSDRPPESRHSTTIFRPST